MHILLVVDYFYPHIGGSEKLFSDLSNFLVSEGHKVSVITSRHDNILPSFESISPTYIIYRTGSSRKNIRWYALRFGLRQKTLLQSVDLIHTSTFSACFAARVLAWWYRKPITITIHEFYLQMRTTLKGWKSIFYRIYEYGIAYLGRDHIITPSNYSKSTVLTIRPSLKSTISVVYNQIDYDFWERSSFLKNESYSKKKKGLYMGRLTKEKGIEDVIYALALVQKNHPDFQMIIVSHLGTPDHKRLVDLSVSLNIQDMILWKESLESEEEVKELMQNCSFGIVPSMMEGFCYTAVQMQAVGLPLVVTDRGALTEVLDHRHVIFISYHDSEALAKAVCTYLDHPRETHPSIKFAHTFSGYTDVFHSFRK